jgi:hypothetical protein
LTAAHVRRRTIMTNKSHERILVLDGSFGALPFAAGACEKRTFGYGDSGHISETSAIDVCTMYSTRRDSKTTISPHSLEAYGERPQPLCAFVKRKSLPGMISGQLNFPKKPDGCGMSGMVSRCWLTETCLIGPHTSQPASC